VHHVLDELQGEFRRAWEAPALDSEPRLILDGPFVVLGHTDTDRRHVVHEEVGEVLRPDHHQRIGTRGFEGLPHPVVGRVESISDRRFGAILASCYSRRVTTDPSEYQAHIIYPQRACTSPSVPG